MIILKPVASGLQVKIGRCIFIQNYIFFLMVFDHVPLLGYVLIEIGLIIQRYLNIINRILQADAYKADVIIDLSNSMTYILQIKRLITIGMHYRYGRFQ